MFDGDSLSLPYSLRIRVGATFVRASAIAAIRASRVLGGGFSQQGFDLGKELLNGIEIGAV
jgi:hypothetical protein